MNKAKLKKNLIYLCIFFIVIIFLFTINVTTSRYIGEISAQDTIVSVPVLSLSNDTASYSIDNMKPGDEKNYEFQVNNFENDQKNEVLLNYYFTIDMGDGTPLKAEIYDITETETKVNFTEEGRTQDIEMNYDTETTKSYKLKIIWDKKLNSLEYSNKEYKCNVILHAEQVI